MRSDPARNSESIGAAGERAMHHWYGPIRGGNRMFAIVLAMFLACIAGCGAATNAPYTTDLGTAAIVSTHPIRIPGVDNFARVSATLYRGAQPTAQGFVELKKMGIKTVINLRSAHDDRGLLAGTGLRYLRIPSHPWHPEDEDVIEFLKAVADPANQPVFVHCQQGADRTGLMVAAYRIVDQHWSRQQALDELPEFGFHTIWQAIPAFVRRLDRDACIKSVQAREPITAIAVP